MLQIRSLSHAYDRDVVLHDVSMDVAAGEIVCLLGASGSGKSTVLRLVAGLEDIQAGEVRIDDELLAGPGLSPAPESRKFGFVFQDHVLFPHLNVEQNVAFGLSDLPESKRHQRAQDELASVGLAGFGQRYPHTLSGGQQQRVALARALATRPRLMLLDEPFASVDSTLRRGLREDARRVLRERNVPAIVVTHDAAEAMEMADRILIIDAGRVVQAGPPHEVWDAPANRFVAELFCNADGFDAGAHDGQVMSPFGAVPVANGSQPDSGECTVIARPEAVDLRLDEGSSCTVTDTRFLGDRWLIVVGAGDARLRSSQPIDCALKVGDPVRVSFEPDGVFVYTRE
jgi:iron(III) transport system ATP-binding protein